MELLQNRKLKFLKLDKDAIITPPTQTHTLTHIPPTPYLKKIMAAMPFTISLAGRHGSTRRPRDMTMADVVSYTNKPSHSGNRARAQVHRRRQQPTQSGRFGFHVLADTNKSHKAAVAVPKPVTAPNNAKAWNLDWSTPMRCQKVQKPKARPAVQAAPKFCKYCKEEGHRIYEVVHGRKMTTCPLLIRKEERRIAAADAKKAAKKAAAERAFVEAERRLAAQIAAAQAKKDEPEVVEVSDSDSDSDSDESEAEDFPALPTLENEEFMALPQVRTTFSDEVEVKHYVKGSPPNKLNDSLAEQAEDAAPQMTAHERQELLNTLTIAKRELANLQQASSGAWADACDEEELEEEIAELEARLGLSA